MLIGDHLRTKSNRLKTCDYYNRRGRVFVSGSQDAERIGWRQRETGFAQGTPSHEEPQAASEYRDASWLLHRQR